MSVGNKYKRKYNDKYNGLYLPIYIFEVYFIFAKKTESFMEGRRDV